MKMKNIFSQGRRRTTLPGGMGWVFLGFLYGLVSSRIPAPHEVGTFWIANLCAPWLVLSFCAGRAQPSLLRAVLGGAGADLACVIGFYLQFLTFDAVTLGLAPGSGCWHLLASGTWAWVCFVYFWAAIAVAAGAVYGAIGWRWQRHRTLWAGVAVALPFVAEPFIWPLRLGYREGPPILWAAEIAGGLVVLPVVWRAARRPGITRGQRRSCDPLTATPVTQRPLPMTNSHDPFQDEVDDDEQVDRDVTLASENDS